jgi:hypothetical protein
MTTAAPRRLDTLDVALVVLFLVGLYLGVSLQITQKIPLTCAPSGFAGLWMLWRRRHDIRHDHLAGLLLVLLLYLGSAVSAFNITYVGKRFTGLVQITYSLVIGYGLFLTLIRAERRQIASILLSFCLAIIVGCVLESWGGLRPISDSFRSAVYEAGVVYDSDRRDEILYGRVRPKLFTSEPSAVTFAYTLMGSMWLVVSPWRLKLLAYAGLLGLGLIVLPGPTLVLMMLLAVPYFIFLSGGAQHASPTRLASAIVLSCLVVLAAVSIGQAVFAERLHEISAGKDASFFYRFTGPMLVAFEMFRLHPWAGAGLTSEPHIADQVMNVYSNAAAFSSAWRIPRIGDVLTNYFWLHWIYLGLVWGAAILVAITVWLRMLGSPSIGYCWCIWAILGQASGSYVGPKTWAVLLMAAAVSVHAARSPLAARTGSAAPAVPLAGHRRPPFRTVRGAT